MTTWLFVREKLRASVPVLLLWVIESEGSSPGRRGFKMAVAGDGQFTGTIGGGMMEHKLVEKARSLLAAGSTTVFLQQQFHDKSHLRDQSGMICSGSQLIAFVPILPVQEEQVSRLLMAYSQQRDISVQLGPRGLQLAPDGAAAPEGLQYKTDDDWHYSERLDQRPVIHIIGAGHVGLALSRQMSILGFYIKLYDNRPGLNTFLENPYAHEKIVCDYETIDSLIPESERDFVVIMTFGYRDDKIVFRKLLHRRFFYIGMLGSDAKLHTLLRELQAEGVPPESWQHVFLPIGIPIHSKTAEEIAISVAAEIIREKNRDLPTGRGELSLEA